MSSANRNSFISSVLIYMPFYLLSLPIALAKFSIIMLNKNGESRYLALALILGKSIQSFTFKYHVSCKFSVDALYHVGEVPSPPIFVIGFFWFCFLS